MISTALKQLIEFAHISTMLCPVTSIIIIDFTAVTLANVANQAIAYKNKLWPYAPNFIVHIFKIPSLICTVLARFNAVLLVHVC